MKDKMLESYRNELVIRSKLFYSNGSDRSPKKVQKHKAFLYSLLERMVKDEVSIKDKKGYLELMSIIERAVSGLKVNKDSLIKRVALNLAMRLKK